MRIIARVNLFLALVLALASSVSAQVPDDTCVLPSGPATFHGGTWPYFGTVADFNNDGRDDIAILNAGVLDLVRGSQTGNGVSVLLSDGAGGFGAPMLIPIAVTDPEMSAVEAADLDDDGDQDLVVLISRVWSHVCGCYEPGGIHVVRQVAPGRFESEPYKPLGGWGESLHIVDLDVDGDPDIVAGVYNDIGLVVLFNEQGTFDDPPLVQPFVPAADFADLDGDGDPDLITAGSGFQYAWSNDGTGVFTDAWLLGAIEATSIRSAVASDVDGDADLDLVFVDHGAWPSHPGGLWVSINELDEHGWFAPLPTLFPVEGSPRGAAAGDVDGDGVNDVVTVNDAGNTIVMFRGRGDGGFEAAEQYHGSGFITEALLVDTDGDAAMDVVAVTSYDEGFIAVHRSEGGVFPGDHTKSLGLRPTMITSADLDGDGTLDLVAGYGGPNYGWGEPDAVSVLLNRSDGTYADRATYDVGVRPRSVVTGDLDGDGDVDLVTANNLDGNISVLRNYGDGTFADDERYSGGPQPWSVAVGDVDGDGDLDVVSSSRYDSELVLLRNDGQTLVGESVPTGGCDLFELTLADLDGDDDLDIVVSDDCSGLRLLSNDGVGVFTPAGTCCASAWDAPPVVADFDGDDDMDIVISTTWQAQLRLYRNDGAGEYVPEVLDTGNPAPAVRAADVDGDGDLDLVAVTIPAEDFETSVWTNGALVVLRNDGRGNFSEPIDHRCGLEPRGLEVADLDGNATLDFAVLNAFDANVSIVLNACPASFCPEDLDGSERVDFGDLLRLFAAWGACPDPCPADLDGSGVVDHVDVVTLLEAWGSC